MHEFKTPLERLLADNKQNQPEKEKSRLSSDAMHYLILMAGLDQNIELFPDLEPQTLNVHLGNTDLSFKVVVVELKDPKNQGREKVLYAAEINSSGETIGMAEIDWHDGTEPFLAQNLTLQEVSRAEQRALDARRAVAMNGVSSSFLGAPLLPASL